MAASAKTRPRRRIANAMIGVEHGLSAPRAWRVPCASSCWAPRTTTRSSAASIPVASQPSRAGAAATPRGVRTSPEAPRRRRRRGRLREPRRHAGITTPSKLRSAKRRVATRAVPTGGGVSINTNQPFPGGSGRRSARAPRCARRARVRAASRRRHAGPGPASVSTPAGTSMRASARWPRRNSVSSTERSSRSASAGPRRREARLRRLGVESRAAIGVFGELQLARRRVLRAAIQLAHAQPVRARCAGRCCWRRRARARRRSAVVGRARGRTPSTSPASKPPRERRAEQRHPLALRRVEDERVGSGARGEEQRDREGRAAPALAGHGVPAGVEFARRRVDGIEREAAAPAEPPRSRRAHARARVRRRAGSTRCGGTRSPRRVRWADRWHPGRAPSGPAPRRCAARPRPRRRARVARACRCAPPPNGRDPRSPGPGAPRSGPPPRGAQRRPPRSDLRCGSSPADRAPA